ncbi:uncharacterized protein EV420DRAFT_115011 [Desarmillaria tabescens]|uniref:Uncharacterized protein n=1 Tax=Armillaria tabescens TaxID=1929756 RepID=A0AA39TYY6_ARMTA|nr:uncharacterized protein EV420DRAFT_115011 [Desarmillaria tabescens]KAK0470443.1 hypothetical protein EV420DRAFT_115011 [Desarmillaria tabescens]
MSSLETSIANMVIPDAFQRSISIREPKCAVGAEPHLQLCTFSPSSNWIHIWILLSHSLTQLLRRPMIINSQLPPYYLSPSFRPIHSLLPFIIGRRTHTASDDSPPSRRVISFIDDRVSSDHQPTYKSPSPVSCFLFLLPPSLSMLLFLCTISTLSFSFFISAASAAHTIRFFNYCGSGTPTIVTHNSRTSINDGTGTYSSANANDGVLHAFLEQGSCGNDGEECSTVDVDLAVPVASVSQTDKFSVPLSLQYSCANNSIYFAQCYDSNCAPTPISCNSFDSDLIITFCPLGSPSITKPSDTSSSSSSSTLPRKLIAPIIIAIVLIIVLVGVILYLRRRNRRLAARDTESHPTPTPRNPPIPERPARASILTVPSYQSTCVASATANKESWQDFKSASTFVKLYPTESEMSAFED